MRMNGHPLLNEEPTAAELLLGQGSEPCPSPTRKGAEHSEDLEALCLC